MADAVLTNFEPVPRTAAAPALSILIVTWNSERWIGRCLRAIPAACGGMSCEVIVHDNGSSDSTLGVVRQSGVRSVIAAQANAGFAAAVNRAASEARGPYLVLLNPDCELAPRSLTLLVDFLERHPNAAAAVPLLTDDGGSSQREFQLRRFPTIWSFAAEILAVDKLWPSNPVTARYRCRDLDLSRPERVDQPAAAAVLLRRDAFDAVGPMDERFWPAWFEDVDYCRRLAGAGSEIWVVPEARARHTGGASLEHIPFEQFIGAWYANMWRYARKWFGRGEVEALRWIIIAGMLLRLPAAIAGVAHPEAGRITALKAYASVLRKAFERWGDWSPSS